jgi:subtilisin family serine protease/PKD repeat protein
MKQISKTAISVLPIFFYLIFSLIFSPIFGQEKSAIRSYTPEAISDAFVANAVTIDDLHERAKYYPFMPEEIVVAVELNGSKANAVNQIREYNWSQFFGDKKVAPIAYLMTKEKTANKSVSLVHLSLAKDMDVFEAMQILDGNPDILWSSPNFHIEGDPREIVPNDPSYGSQYHHPLMQNDLAWDYTYGNSDIMLGITDDGVEVSHSDLNTNIWVNPGEIPGNGIDDDNNGYIDDVNGWDFSSGNNNPSPNSLGNDHGTHVSGICAGRTDNSIGIAGVSGHSTILPIQFYGVGAWTATVCNASFTYAADNGANIVNTSYNINGWVGDPVFTAGMQYMHDAGVLHFNSGGNGSELNPARQAFHQTLLVVSTDASDVKSSFSNYGTGMDISAPGSDIYSSVTSNGYGYKSGTSMAAPNAAGAAALIWSANPSWNSYQVAAQLLATADDIDGVNPSYAGLLGAGRVNTYSAISTTLGAPILTSTEGMPDEGSTVAPDEVDEFTVAFSQVMDPATVNDIANFELSGAGPDNIFGNGDDVLYTLSASTNYMLGTNYLTFEVNGPPFIDGLHRIRLVSGGLTNPFGTSLDGDENGTGGDDFIRNFTIGIPAPIADFEASNTSPVPDADVIFTDLTYGGPSAWTWTITPTTFSFVNGTDANSQNPEVQFADFGYYSVTLEVSNIAGSDTETKVDYINVITCVYCPAEGNNGTDEWISNVTFNTIDNSSVAGTGYTDYTSISTDVDAGSTHDISISCGSTGTWNENYWVYFDWNQDCDFDDPGESYDLGETSGPGTLTTSVLVPADAVPGSVRMRAFLKYNSDPTSACENGFSYGEVEDYTINVGLGGSGPVFFDDFENGISNWEVTGAWGLTDEYANSPGNSLADSPGGNYLPDQEIYATMVTGVDLSDPSILSADVNWWMIMDIENGNFDYLYVQVSTDDFATFTQIASFFGEGMLDPWVEYSYSLGAFLGNDNVKVRFHFSSDAGYEVDGCYIDDFSITTSDVDNAAPEVFFDVPFAYEGTADDYVIEAEIIDATGVASAEAFYTVDGVAQPNIVGVNTGGSNWEFTIPMQEAGYQVDFVINATDSSPAANEATTDTASYIAGEYIGYDNAFVDFYTEIGPAGTGGILGTAVVFTIEDPSRMVYALIRNYMDQSVGENDEMIVHIWSDGGGGPGADLIDPITIMPEANLVNTRAFTRIDLRDYEAELGSLEGDVYVGFTVPSGVVRTTISQPGIANRSFQSVDGSTWATLTDDYHYRIVLGPEVENTTPAPTDLTAMVEDNDIIVNWVAPENNSENSEDFIGYNVYYKFNSGSFEMIAEEITETIYTHVDAAVGGLHTYYVTASYDEGESLPSNEAEVLITSVEDQISRSTMLYPNPASDVVNIKSSFDILEINIYNHKGQVMLSEQVNNTIYQINTSQFTSGLYFFRIETNEGTINKRIIIQ